MYYFITEDTYRYQITVDDMEVTLDIVYVCIMKKCLCTHLHKQTNSNNNQLCS